MLMAAIYIFIWKLFKARLSTYTIIKLMKGKEASSVLTKRDSECRY